MPTFNDPVKLQKYIEKEVLKAMEVVCEAIKEVLQEFIQSEYYDQYPNPKQYVRTEDLKNRAPVIIVPKMVGNKIVCGVELDPTQLRQIDGKHGIDREYIIKLASQGYHGTLDIETEGKFLEATMKELFQNQKHMKVLAQALSDRGIWVKLG